MRRYTVLSFPLQLVFLALHLSGPFPTEQLYTDLAYSDLIFKK
jgi:hypothetical protein